MTPADVLKLIKEKDAAFADLRFTDTIGKEQHVTVPTRLVDEGFFKDGKMFDGSSIAGGVFTDDLIDAYIELKMKEVTRLRMTTHPIEVEMYYSL